MIDMRLRVICGIFMILAILLNGCTPSNYMVEAQDALLPQIDPEDGVEQNIPVTLYYRLIGEPYLVGVERNIVVYANESLEKAVIRVLTAGPSALSGNVAPVINKDTTVESIELVGDILYVTVSKEFLRVNAEETASEEKKAQERRLSLYALVNTLTKLGKANRVMIYVDLDDSGEGVRLQRAMVGLPTQGSGSTLLEPLEFHEPIVANPKSIAQCIFDHLVAGDYDKAYVLMAESERGGQQKPDYAAFETTMLSTGKFKSYSIHSSTLSDDGLTATVEVTIEYTYRDGTTVTLKNIKLPMEREGDIHKLGYASLLQALGGRSLR